VEARTRKLEALADKIVGRLGTLERDLAIIKSNYATRRTYRTQRTAS
jgi:hypothetical protein